MFGYVTINDKELSKDEKARFLRLYCGVCEDLRGVCGKRGRFTLTYDAAFLALVLTSLYEPEETHRKLVCAAHPMVKHECEQSEITSYAADMNVLLSFYNLMDDWQDEGARLKKAGADMLKPAFEICREKHSPKAQFIENELKALSELEKSHCRDIDKLAGCSGRMLGEIFAYKQDMWADTLRKAGDSLGRFIYIMDAWKDAQKDRRTGAFNALSEISGEADYEDRVFNMLTCEISLCANAIEALPLVKDINIIRNVIYSGVWIKYCQKRKGAIKEEDK